MSGMNNWPLHFPLPAGVKPVISWVPTSASVPPLRASALALSDAQSTVPQYAAPHASIATTKLPDGFFQRPVGGVDSGAAISIIASSSSIG